MMTAIIAFIAGLWAGSGFTWYRVDCRSLQRAMRIWRSLTYLPLVLLGVPRLRRLRQALPFLPDKFFG